MKYYRIILVCLAVCCGCGKFQPSDDEKACASARVLTDALKTNATVRVIMLSKGVRTSLKNVKEREERKSLVSDWCEALFNVPVDGLPPSGQYDALKESANILDWDVVGAMYESCNTVEEVWSLRFRVVDWLDAQLKRMRKLCDKKGVEDRERRAAWTYYQAMAEYREQLVENFERFYLDERKFVSSEKQLGELRQRLAEKIGRPVRRPSEIQTLGIYVRQVRDRIQKERSNSVK